MMTSSTSSGDTPALSSAPFIANAPNRVAEISANMPPKLPNGVRRAETIYTSFFIMKIYNLDFKYGSKVK